jgi:serine/threonine-protein kinase
MVWASQYADQPIEVIYALYNNGTYQRYVDDWVEGIDPMAGAENPPAGKLAPIRGFGKVWRINPPVQQGLGWATTNENGTSGQIQRFERGEMIFVAALNQTFIFIGGTTWRLDGTPF